MTMRAAITVSFSFALAGCMGGYNAPGDGTPGTPGSHTDGTPDQTITTPGTTANAEALFINNVQGFISTECASCHAVDKMAAGPKFLGSDGTYYGNLVTDPRMVNNKPDQSFLITHKHFAGQGSGTDPTVMQQTSIKNWITQENLERTLPAPPVNIMIAAQALAQFAGCMTLGDFQSSQMNQIWTMQTNNGLQCNSCHQTDSHDVLLSTDDATNFGGLQTDMHDLLRFVVADVQPDGTCKDIIQANRFWERGNELGHPPYTNAAPTIQGWVNQFYTLSYAKWKAGNCPTAPPLGM
jgi:hypothetical protein